MSPSVAASVPLVVAYLVGALPFGYLVGRLRGVNLFTVGSGNIGATNAARVLGWPFGALVFVFDFLKGAVPVACAVPLAEALHTGSSTAFGPPDVLRVVRGGAGVPRSPVPDLPRLPRRKGSRDRRGHSLRARAGTRGARGSRLDCGAILVANCFARVDRSGYDFGVSPPAQHARRIPVRTPAHHPVSAHRNGVRDRQTPRERSAVTRRHGKPNRRLCHARHRGSRTARFGSRIVVRRSCVLQLRHRDGDFRVVQ